MGIDFKFYFVDEDLDIISVQNQSELDDALFILNGKVKFLVAQTTEEARQ